MSDEGQVKRRRGRPRIHPPREPKRGPTLPERFEPRFLADADHRHATIREVRRRIDRLKAGSGCDSAQREILCEHAAFLSVWLETQERQALEGGRFDAGSFVQSLNAMVGLLRAIGLERKVRSVGLKGYLAERSA